jgi:hypothetical protein
MVHSLARLPLRRHALAAAHQPTHCLMTGSTYHASVVLVGNDPRHIEHLSAEHGRREGKYGIVECTRLDTLLLLIGGSNEVSTLILTRRDKKKDKY